METESLDELKRKMNKKKKESIKDQRIWSHRYGIQPVDMQKVMGTQNKIFNYAYSLLFSDNRAIKMNNPIYKRRQVNRKKKSQFLKYISNDSEKILNKAYNKINFMKNESKELQKLNSLSLQKTSKTYFQTNRPKTSDFNNSRRNRVESASTNYQTQTINLNKRKKSNKNLFQSNISNSIGKNKTEVSCFSNDKNDLNLNHLYTNENTKESTNPNLNSFCKKKNFGVSFNKKKTMKKILSLNKNKHPLKTSRPNFNLKSPINLFQDKGEEKYRELINIDIPKLYSTNKKKHLNLSRLNDIYRVQMNKTLSKYNAENHLKELNKFQRDDIEVRQNMEKIKAKMNQKINDRSIGQYYKKEYLKLKEENEKIKRAKSMEKKPFPTQIPFNILFRNTNENKSVKVFPYGYKIRAYYDYCSNCERIQKSKNNDLLELGADILLGHLHTKDYELVYNSLDELFNVLEIEPIIKYIDTFKNEKINKDKNILSDRIRNYFPLLTETEKTIQKMEQNQIIKRPKINEENNILEKINEIKRIINEKFQ
jgi:hypothetical protein